jgi:hypothetical protein
VRPAHHKPIVLATLGTAVASLAVALGAVTPLGASSGETAALVSISPSNIVAVPGSPLLFAVVVENVTDKPLHHPDEPGGLGAFEFTLPYDPLVMSFQNVTPGPFLSSSGRQVTCLPPLLDTGIVRFGCVTEGNGPGASGGGTLATLQFAVFCPTAAELSFFSVNLAEPFGKAIPAEMQGGQLGCSAGATTTPTRTPTPTATGTPDGPRKALGDVNDDLSVDSTDALLVVQHVAGLLQALINPESADLDGDDQVTSIDATLILQCVVGVIDICH